MTQQGDTLTDLERLALARGLARRHHGRLIPIVRGGDETDEEKAAREAEEAAAKRKAEEEAAAAANKTFTQAELDRIVQDRLARERQKYEGFDDLKAKAEQFDKLQDEQKSELEKERDRAAKAEERATKIEAEAKEIRLRSSLLAEAAKADRKIVDPEAALALLDRSTLTLDDEGNPTNIAQAMDALLEAKPFLVATNGGSRGNADLGARGNGSGAEQLTSTEGMSPEEIAKALEEGRLADYLKTTK